MLVPMFHVEIILTNGASVYKIEVSASGCLLEKGLVVCFVSGDEHCKQQTSYWTCTGIYSCTYWPINEGTFFYRTTKQIEIHYSKTTDVFINLLIKSLIQLSVRTLADVTKMFQSNLLIGQYFKKGDCLFHYFPAWSFIIILSSTNLKSV
jgi:hypothetical protein